MLTIISTLRTTTRRHFSNQTSSWLSIPGNPLIKWPTQPQPPSSSSLQPQNPNNIQQDYATISNLMKDHTITTPTDLKSALSNTQINPTPPLLRTLFTQFDSSPMPLFTLFQWAHHQSPSSITPALFNQMIDLLGKSRQFDSAWTILLPRLHHAATIDTFTILIRRYARAGMPFPAIRTFEFAQNLGIHCTLFEILLDSLCKEGHVRIASEYVSKRNEARSLRVYNILLNGWFRSRKLKHVQRLWEEMRKDNVVVPTVVTYGTLVEGYCRMRRVERALELIGEMRMDGIQPNAVVFNPVVDALAEAGRFKEALGMLERFSVLESGPTLSTYNSLVKGFCKAKDLVGASKILKMMTSRGFAPTTTTYNYFFRYFSKFGKIEEAMNLYTKMIQSGHVPDRLTYHLLIKMLCEEERLELLAQVSKEMRARGHDLDLDASTMLVHLLCKLHRLEEACIEFQDMIRRGIIPQYLTYKKLTEDLKMSGMGLDAQKLSAQMSSLPHSTNLPDTYREKIDTSRDLRLSIMKKAQAMSDILKTSNDPRELSKMKKPSQNSVSSANQLIEDIRSRFSSS